MTRVWAENFEEWRSTARNLLTAGRTPEEVYWEENGYQNLFDKVEFLTPISSPNTKVPADFVSLANGIACHRNPEKWSLFYRTLWRLAHGEPHLLKIATDPLIHRLRRMDGEIRRDAHKTKAFVRFRLLQENDEDHYIAWHRPDHKVLPLVAGFFQRRFAVMKWSIVTPDQSLAWDGEALKWGSGLPASEVAHEDKFEDVWRTYYRATFNPARIKIKMMKQEMPVRHWATLPEARIIPDLLSEAETRVETMIGAMEGDRETAEDYFPPVADYPSLRSAAAGCRACGLCGPATQTVFGEGNLSARIMLVGEQPGEEEDLQGRPFIGPAGQLLTELLEKAGLPRDELYLTNAVKHFRFVQRGKKRIHQPPDVRNIIACKPWLQTEIRLVQPQVIVALGAAAGRALVHQGFTLKHDQHKDLFFDGIPIYATWHPSAALRATQPQPRADIEYHISETLRRALKFR